MLSYSEVKKSKNMISFGWVETSFLPQNESLILSSKGGKVSIATLSSYTNYFTSLVGSLPYDFLRNGPVLDKNILVKASLESGSSGSAELCIQSDFLYKMAKLLVVDESFSWEGTEFKKIEEKID